MNERQGRAYERILEYAPPAVSILEVGCGYGDVTAALAEQHDVWACDIDASRISECIRKHGTRRIHWLDCDVVTQFPRLAEWAGSDFAVIAMVDSLEHIPLEHHGPLIQNLRSLLAVNGVMVLTYPSPRYQAFAHWHHPEKLQAPADEIVELEELAMHMTGAGLALVHYSRERIWDEEYVHAVWQAQK